jgi:hypothetical protein
LEGGAIRFVYSRRREESRFRRRKWRGLLTSSIFKPFETEGEVRAAFVFGEGMDFVENHPTDGAERGEPARLAEENAEALGRGEENMGRRGELLLARVAGGVAGTESDADGRDTAVDGFEWGVEILLQVVGKGAEWRNVDGVDAGLESAVGFEEGEFVEDGKEGGEGLAGARGGDDEDVSTGFDVRPGCDLGRSGRREFLREPFGDDRWP